jgi:hypothetical protein
MWEVLKMDLLKFFIENFNEIEDKYYADFYDSYILHNPYIYNFVVTDEKELIERWKEMLYPSLEWHYEFQANFALMNYWLFKMDLGSKVIQMYLKCYNTSAVYPMVNSAMPQKRNLEQNQTGFRFAIKTEEFI